MLTEYLTFSCMTKQAVAVNLDDDDPSWESDTSETAVSLAGREYFAGGMVGMMLGMMKDVAQLQARWAASAAPPRCLPPDAQTVVFFDWDDTLLCTSHLGAYADDNVPTLLQQQLEDLEASVRRLLELAARLGRVIIVTNAEEGWVQQSAARFLPGLAPALEGVPVLSARSLFEAWHPGDAAAWKARAFLSVQSQLDVSGFANVISVGDSSHELAAAKALGRRFAGSAVKTVRFRAHPGPDVLRYEVDYLADCLVQVVQDGSDYDLVL